MVAGASEHRSQLWPSCCVTLGKLLTLSGVSQVPHSENKKVRTHHSEVPASFEIVGKVLSSGEYLSRSYFPEIIDLRENQSHSWVAPNPSASARVCELGLEKSSQSCSNL